MSKRTLYLISEFTDKDGLVCSSQGITATIQKMREKISYLVSINEKTNEIEGHYIRHIAVIIEPEKYLKYADRIKNLVEALMKRSD